MLEFENCTGSIKHTLTGQTFEANVVEVIRLERILAQKNWIFDWKKEIKNSERRVFKLVAPQTPQTVHGLMSISIAEDHVYMHLIESAGFNRGSKKLYERVAGNLIAFACRFAFSLGFEGFLVFESKTRLVSHYQTAIGARILAGNKLYINTTEAKILINTYLK